MEFLTYKQDADKTILDQTKQIRITDKSLYETNDELKETIDKLIVAENRFADSGAYWAADRKKLEDTLIEQGDEIQERDVEINELYQKGFNTEKEFEAEMKTLRTDMAFKVADLKLELRN